MPEALEQFIHDCDWIFAKTYADTWPHEYIVREQVNGDMFDRLAGHIDTHGHKEHFYRKQMTYLEFDGHVYWHMDNIINRCLPEDTYSRREAEGRLP